MTYSDNLNPDQIQAHLTTTRIGRKVIVYNTTSSTSDVAAAYATNSENDGLVVFAEEQTAGRGRAQHRWYSRRGHSILASVLLCNTAIKPELLSLTTAVAVAEAIGNSGRKQAKIKWPNDILLNGKKAAGILLESRKSDGSGAYILGIGINCHQQQQDFPAELRATATSIDIESRRVCDRISLAKRLLTSADHWLAAAEKSSEEILDQWSKLSALLNQRVTLIFNGAEFTGNCIGIDPERGLILQFDTGGLRFFTAAHTRVVK